MDSKQLHQWEQSVDSAENNHLTANLPKDAPPGTTYMELGTDNIHRRWISSEVVGGNAGARWAYWKSWKDADNQPGIGPNPNFQVVVDAIFNGDAHHFCGMLAIPYSGPFGPRTVWVLVDPRTTPPPEQRIYEEKQPIRYERSKEIYDVDTGEVRKI